MASVQSGNFTYFGPEQVVPEATGQVIGFIRDPKKFRINDWVQYINVDSPVFRWAELERDQSVRVVSDDLFIWQDGSPRPTGNHNLTRWKMHDSRCYRRYYPWTLGEQTIDVNRRSNELDPETVESKSCASQAMVNRTNRIVNMCETVGNWGGSNATANALNGGFGTWDNASDDPISPNYLAIKKSLMEALRRIILLTNGVVNIDDLVLVLSPNAAIAMAATSEVHDYVRYTSGMSVLQNQMGTVAETFGLPNVLYGFKVVVETAVRVSVPPTQDGVQVTLASGDRTFVKNDSTAFLVSRPGKLDGVYGTKSFSTVQCYFFKYEMAVEAKADSWNKRSEGGVVEQFQEVLAAAPAGYLIQSILS